MSEDLINYERMFRDVVCINPEHDEVIVINTNEIKPRCPACDNLMVVVVRSALTKEVIKTPREK
jgi:hypothetical protein